MSPHPYGPIPTARSELLALLRDRQREFARLNALTSAATLFSDIISALELHFAASDDATVDLSGALAHSHASERSLRRWVAEGVVKKRGDQYVVATLPVLTANARARTRNTSRRRAVTARPQQDTTTSATRAPSAFNVDDAAEQFRARAGTTAKRAQRKESK